MRRYDEPVEVRRGGDGQPEMLWWRGRVWKVLEVVSHWVETGAWWQAAGVGALLGSDADPSPDESGAGAAGSGGTALAADLLAEREVWRVVAGDRRSQGVFDLSLDWAEGRWRLDACMD